MYQVGSLFQQTSPLEQRLAHQSDLRMLQVTQTAVDDACSTTGCAGGEIMLLQEKCAPPGPGALPRNGDAIDTAANHDHLEAFVLERPPDCRSKDHARSQILRTPSIILPRFVDGEKITRVKRVTSGLTHNFSDTSTDAG